MRKHWPLVVVAMLTAVGGALRLYGLHHRGVWWDEISVWFDALSGHRSPQEAPLYTLLARATMAAFRRDDEYALHLAGVICGTATIPAAYLLGHAVGRRAAGLALAALVTFSPMLLSFSQEGRPYALLILLTTLQLAFAIRLVDRWRGSTLVLLLSASAGALATHLVALPFTLALGAVLFVALAAQPGEGDRRATITRLAALLVGGGAAIALGLLWTIGRPSFDVVMTGPYRFGALRFVRHVIAECGPGYARADRPWGAIDVIASLYLVLAIVGIGVLWRRRHAVALLVLPSLMLLVTLYLRLGEKSVWPWFRYATPMLVPFLALGAAAIAVQARPVAAVLVATLIIAHVHPSGGMRAWISDAKFRRGSQYRDAADQLAHGPIEFVGTIFARNASVFADETDRLTSSYAIYRHDDLPAYFASDQQPLRRIEWRSVVGRLPVPIRTAVEVTTLPRGNYAVFLGWDSYRGCAYLDPRMRDPSPPVTAGTFIPCFMP